MFTNKLSLLALASGMMALAAAPAQASFQCNNLAGQIQQKVNQGASGSSQLANDLQDLAQVASSINQLVNVLSSSGGTVNVSGELMPIADTMSSDVRSASSSVQNGLKQLRRTLPDNENLGSKVRVIAAQAAGDFDSATRALQMAADRCVRIKDRVAVLMQQLNSSGNLEQYKQNVLMELSRLNSLNSALNQISVVRNISFDISSYTSSCSSNSDFSCQSLRSDLNLAGQNSSSDASQVDTAGRDLVNSARSTDQLVRSIKAGQSVNLVSLINGYMDSNVLPVLQDAANRTASAAGMARAASQDESGVGYDQKAGQAIGLAESADNAVDSSANSVSSLRGQIQFAAGQVGQGTNFSGTISQLQFQRQQLDRAGSTLSQLVQRLGRPGWSGDLADVDRALSNHRQRCEPF